MRDPIEANAARAKRILADLVGIGVIESMRKEIVEQLSANVVTDRMVPGALQWSQLDQQRAIDMLHVLRVFENTLKAHIRAKLIRDKTREDDDGETT